MTPAIRLSVSALAVLLLATPGSAAPAASQPEPAATPSPPASEAAGVDDQFHRHPRTLTPIDQPPYYAFTSAPLLGWTNGGPRRNERAQVLDPFGRVIPGLYAAGTVSSTYSWCKDGGFHIADALAFGRVAGRTAAAEASA